MTIEVALVISGISLAFGIYSGMSNNMGYSAATASNYLYIINNIVGILKKHGLIKT